MELESVSQENQTQRGKKSVTKIFFVIINFYMYLGTRFKIRSHVGHHYSTLMIKAGDMREEKQEGMCFSHQSVLSKEDVLICPHI